MQMLPAMFGLAIFSALIAAVGYFIVHKFGTPIDVKEHQGFVDAMLGIVGTLVSIMLGLLVASALDHYKALEQSIDTEASNVAQVFRLSAGLPPPAQKRLRDLCVEYTDGVIHDEWPAMEHGESSARVSLTYAQLVHAISSFEPATNGQTNIHNALISTMQTIGDCRRQRLLVLNSKRINHLMPLLLLCSAIVLTFSFLYIRRGDVFHSGLIALVAIALGANLGLIYVSNHPFSGDWMIKPVGFEYNMSLIEKASPQLLHALGVDDGRARADTQDVDVKVEQ